MDVATAAFLENDDALYINEERTEVRHLVFGFFFQENFFAFEHLTNHRIRNRKTNGVLGETNSVVSMVSG